MAAVSCLSWALPFSFLLVAEGDNLSVVSTRSYSVLLVFDV